MNSKKRSLLYILLFISILSFIIVASYIYYDYTKNIVIHPLPDKINSVPHNLKEFFYSGDKPLDYQARRLAELKGGGAKALIDFFSKGSADFDIEQIVGNALLYSVDDPVPELLKLLKSKNPNTKSFAIYILGHLGSMKSKPYLANYINDKTPVRSTSNRNIGDVAKTAIERIDETIKDPYSIFRRKKELDEFYLIQGRMYKDPQKGFISKD